MSFSALVGPLLSSSDKDDEEISKLTSLIRNFTSHFHESYGKILPFKLSDSVVESVLSTLLYFTFTSGSGLQTLGEEVNLLVLHRDRKIPGLLIKTLYVLLQVFGTHKLLDMIGKMYPGCGVGLIKQMRLPISLLVMHGGSVITQSALGLKNHPLKKPASLYPFYVIILADMLYILIELYKRNTKKSQAPPPELELCPVSSPIDRTDIQCSVCRDNIVLGHVTASPCGHVGCWECLNRAAQVKPVCPVCNGPIFPLLALRNIRSETG